MVVDMGISEDARIKLTERHWLSRMNFKHSLAAAAFLISGLPLSVLAEGDDSSVFVTANDTWSVEIVPYAWLPGVKGDLTIRNTNVGVDQSFNDIFKAVKFASSALGVARYNNWLIYTQLDYFSLSTSKLENAPPRASLDIKDLLYTQGFGYRINGWSSGQTFDILVGAQGLHADNTLSLYRFGSVSNSNDVVDAVLIFRPSFQLSQHWLLNPTMSVGGGDSKYTYQLQPQFQYQFNSTWEMRFGYRKLHYNINGSRGNNLDASLSGPLFGFGVTF